MKEDFSGYATKAGLVCTDGRTIMPDAFKHQDKVQVPLVWQHGHNDPTNVLGHAILENRKDGVYAYCFFNNTPKAVTTRELVEHGDINSLSIWANKLVERSQRVLSGAIREVSLVLSGANPGALIENVSIRHSDGELEVQEGEAIIHTGLVFELAAAETKEVVVEGAPAEEVVAHADETMTFQEIYESLDDAQKDVVHYMVGMALESATGNETLAQSSTNQEGNTDMTHKNVFEGSDALQDDGKFVLSHEDAAGIMADAMERGSLKKAVNSYALAHGITNIDRLFPEAKLVGDTPEWVKRRTEYVEYVLSGVRKSPIARIKTISADLTFEDARAKGYIKGSLKKEEFFDVMSRTTTPTTVYKKQALDRDDIIDITDFNVVAWLEAEMRIMLDEELARAILVGDGRDSGSGDKINEGNIRPIAKDNELYTTTIFVNVDDANSSYVEVVDAVIANRHKYKGTGQPVFFTTEQVISKFMILKDGDGRRLYRTLAELASELRVSAIVPVEVMADDPNMIGIMVNLSDYVLGMDKGGEVSRFNQFDIDYNKEKYLIETRCSGALTKVKSALVIKKVASTDVLVIPAMPSFNVSTGALTITNQTGVVYKNASNVVINAAGSPYTVTAGTTYVVNATPASGFYFPTTEDDSWSFTRPA